MKNKKTYLERKRRSDAFCPRLKPSQSGGEGRSTKSLNDIRISLTSPEFGKNESSNIKNQRRRSTCFADEDEEETENRNRITTSFGNRRRSKRTVDFREGLDEVVVGSSKTADFGEGKTSFSTNNFLAEKRKYRPPLLSQMSDPSDCGGTPRCGKRDSSGKSLMDFTGKEPQSVSYSSAFDFKGNFDPLSCSWPSLSTKNGYLNKNLTPSSLEDSWKSFYSAMVTSQTIGLTPAAAVRNPNKAVLTLEYPSTKILIGNDAAHRLFALGHDQLVGHRLTEMITGASTIFNTKENGDAASGPSVMDRSALSNDRGGDELTAVCGKVIEIVDALEAVSPVAIWLYPLIQNNSNGFVDGARSLNRCLAVLEPVERITSECTLGPKGRIFACDDYVADMFGYRSSTEILGFNITELLPALVLPTSKFCTEQFRQNLTGRFRSGASFPVTVKLLPEFDGDSVVKYDVTFYIYTTISGLITVLPNGIIHSFNNHFVSTMFGHRADSLNEKHITSIIPKFYAETGSVDTDLTGNTFVLDENCLGSPVVANFAELSLNDRGSWLNRHESAGSSNSMVMMRPAGHSPSSTITNGLDATSTAEAAVTATTAPFCSTPTTHSGVGGDVNDNSVTEEDMHAIAEGSFWGFGLHRDGSLFGIGYQIRRLVLKDGSILYCIWVVRDPEAYICHNLTRFAQCGGAGFHKSASSIDSGSELFFETATKGLPGSKTVVDLESEEKEYIRGEYAQHFDTLQQIGKGAYGCVKMAARKSDGLLVVTKFIRKDRILTDCWSEDKRLGRVPIEISLLAKLKHENIVEVIAVYQNETYFQMVMEKHGRGMDLFEFIDRHPLMDEKLASYLFRQVVSAVSYLHNLSIVHRDIKDENVIIDEHFRCKLIDFGSAAYFKEGKTFSTICGTIEYCSPEVLTGNRYAGPELEMWSLGILLYTLLFFENPFDSVEETIQANLEPPWDISEGLFNLLSWLLHPIPQNRATISDVERHWWVAQSVDIKQYKFEEIIILNDIRELNPPKYISDLQTAVSTQASPVPKTDPATSQC